MKSYAFDKNQMETYEFIVLMKKRTGGGMTPIKRAPKKECLEMFGGPIDIKTFRENSVPIVIQLPNEHYQIPIINTNTFTQLLTNSNSELQLKRSKPLERSKGRLEKVLNKCSDAAKKEKNLNLTTGA
jgi:hypothetical protein